MTTNAIRPGRAVPGSARGPNRYNGCTHYEPSRDGQRFLVNPALDVADSPITVVLNWTSMLNK